MKKIAFVTSLVNLGGTELSLLNLLNNIPRNKFDLSLILLDLNSEIEKQIPQWVKVYRIKPITFSRKLKKNIETRNYLGVARDIVIEGKRKVLQRIYPAGHLKRQLCLLNRYEKITDAFDIAISWALPKSIENVYVLNNIVADRKIMWIHLDVTKDGFYMGMEKEICRYDKIVCVSEACKRSFEELVGDCKSKTRVVHNVLNCSMVKEKSKIEVNDIPNAEFLLVTCGRLSGEKQPEYSVYIAKELIKKGISSFKWLFVGGDGNIADSFKKKVEENSLQNHIIFTGFKENPYPYIKKADIYVQMSRHESYCLALAEAGILEVPIVTTNFPSAYEIVNDGKTGIIVYNSPEAVLHGIEKLIIDRTLRETMKDNCSQTVAEKIGSADEFIQFIEEI